MNLQDWINLFDSVKYNAVPNSDNFMQFLNKLKDFHESQVFSLTEVIVHFCHEVVLVEGTRYNYEDYKEIVESKSLNEFYAKAIELARNIQAKHFRNCYTETYWKERIKRALPSTAVIHLQILYDEFDSSGETIVKLSCEEKKSCILESLEEDMINYFKKMDDYEYLMQFADFGTFKDCLQTHFKSYYTIRGRYVNS
jgi:hypothetical protein